MNGQEVRELKGLKGALVLSLILLSSGAAHGMSQESAELLNEAQARASQELRALKMEFEKQRLARMRADEAVFESSDPVTPNEGPLLAKQESETQPGL